MGINSENLSRDGLRGRPPLRRFPASREGLHVPPPLRGFPASREARPRPARAAPRSQLRLRGALALPRGACADSSSPGVRHGGGAGFFSLPFFLSSLIPSVIPRAVKAGTQGLGEGRCPRGEGGLQLTGMN